MGNRSLSNLTLNLIAETGSFNVGMESAERSIDKVERAAMKQKNALVKLMGQIDPLVSEYAKLDKMERQLERHRAEGRLDGSEYALYSKRLAQMREEYGKASSASGQLQASQQKEQAELQGLLRQLDPVSAKLAEVERHSKLLNAAFASGSLDKGQYDKAISKLNQMRSAIDGTTEAQLRAEAAAKQQQLDLQRLQQKLNPAISKIKELDREIKELDKSQELLKDSAVKGLIDPKEYYDYSKRLAQMRSELGKTSDDFDNTGMSAKQMAFATRGLPAQFTDIAVSLQAGQNPMTVFLQQGGQLKDMFGGVGPAAKAMGGYIMGLINPFTIAATAAGVMALAYYQGSIEADRLRNALILTGNSAGTNADNLMDAARRIDAISGTQRQAAAALAEVAKTGKFFGDQIELVGLAAIKMENVTGKAMSETIAEFVKLADDPVKAAEELNKKYNFLTAAVYQQAAALKEAGKSNEAADLVFKAYSDAIGNRTSDITENLGYVEQAWKAVKETSAEAWDAVLNIGRQETFDERIAALKKANEELKPQAKTGVWGYGLARDQIKANEKAIEDLELQQQVLNDIAEEEGKIRKLELERIERIKYLAAENEKSLTNEQKRTKEIEKYNQALAKLRKDDPNNALLNPEVIKRTLASIEEKFKDSAKTTKAFADDAATSYLMRLRETQASLQGQLDSNTKLTQAQKELLQFEQQIADLKSKDILTADQKSYLAKEQQLRAENQMNVALAEQIKLRDQALRQQSYSANLAANLAAEQQRNADKLASFGLGDKAQQRLGDRQSIEREIESAKGKALSDNLAGRTTDEEYQQQLLMLKDHQAKLLDEKNAYYIALDAKQADWTNGARSSMENYIDAAADMAGQTERLMDNAFGGMTDALTDFVTSGKADFAELTKSILADLAKIAMQKAIAGFIGSMFGFADGGVVGGSSASDYTGDAYQKWIKNGKSSGGYTGAGGKYEPAGIVHKGEVVWSQQDIARAGGVATVEAMRKGHKGYADGGVVGGAAYNGVPAAAMAGTSPNVIINQQIIVPESNSNNGANNTNMNEVIKAYAESSKQGTKTQIALELRPGGMIWRAMKGGY